ncbi:MAG: hypothetical protein CMJ46_12140 [Planctomyces sp.]|nr:hypothetical protein [Planctomyces sp.]
MRFECQQCAHIMRVPDHAAGKSITCKSCGTRQRVPGRGSHRIISSDKQRRPAPSIGKYIWLGLGLVLVVVAGFFIPSLVNMAQDPPDSWASVDRVFEDNLLRVELVDVQQGPIKTEVLPGKVIESDMDILEIQVKVTNNSESESISYSASQLAVVTSGGPSLEDEKGNPIEQIDLASLAGMSNDRPRPELIPPGESAIGAYHFELPRKSADELRLTIPRGNFGQSGAKVELKCPTNAIQQN